ncbi:MAG: glutathione S-transferase N-terminal domain-containing protein [Beijerinckiaceae bacterium]|nr:glutathione S-transferase N-terminal domain-containing protein [Beijerinckiaceae bacterium]
MTFYMTPGSCSTGIHILLEELDETFAVTVVNLPSRDHFKPDFVAMNPKSTIPVLVCRDGQILTEVPAIAFWLARMHPRARLWPEAIELETRAIEMMAYVTGTIHGQGFARIFTAATFTDHEPALGDVIATGRQIVEKGFAVLDRALAEDGYALGPFSVVDPVLFYVEFWADKLKMTLPRRVASHYRLMLARPAVQRVLREEGYNPAALGLEI